MTATIDLTFIDARIAFYQSAITAIEAAILALESGVQSYSLDTGQTRQTVTKANLGSLRLQLDNAVNQLTVWVARRSGGTVTMGPGF